MNALKKPLILGTVGVCLVVAAVIATQTSDPSAEPGAPAPTIATVGDPTDAPLANEPAAHEAEVAAVSSQAVEPAMTPVADAASTDEAETQAEAAMQPAEAPAETATPAEHAKADEAETVAVLEDEPVDALQTEPATTPQQVEPEAIQIDLSEAPSDVQVAKAEPAEPVAITNDNATARETTKADAGNRQARTATLSEATTDLPETTNLAEAGAADNTTGLPGVLAAAETAEAATPVKTNAAPPSVPVTPARQTHATDTAGGDDALAAREQAWANKWAVLADELDAKNAAVAKTNGTTGDSDADATSSTATRQPPVVATLEGVGGGVLTPSAYLLNPGGPCDVFGLPTVGTRYMHFGSKDLTTLTIGETLWGRVELSYAMGRFGLGGFDDAVQHRLGRDIVRDEAYMHTWSIRGLLIEEDSFGLPTPAITAGVSFKYNDSIQTIDRRTGHALRAAGFDKSNGVDYTLTATKTVCDPWLGRPLSLTAGLRFSNGAQMGLMGFDNSCHLTFEGSLRYFPTDWLAIGYEFRQKADPYREIPGVYGEEDSAHAITADVRVTDNMTLSTGWTMMGHVANGSADCGWMLGMQWDF